MLIDRSHGTWAALFALTLAGATAGYVVYVRAEPDGPSGGSWPGLAFGAAGASCIVFAGLIGARRKVSHWRLGSAAFWLRGHLWLGLLALPLILFHGGLALGGPMTTVLLALLVVVVGSGIVGLVLQQIIPREMPLGRTAEQIEPIASQLRERAALAVAAVCGGEGILVDRSDAPPAPRKGQPVAGSGVVRRAYFDVVQGHLATPLDAAAVLDDGFFERLRAQLPRDDAKARVRLEGAVAELRELCRERTLLGAQKRRHRWLQAWLFVHVPAWIALLVLGAVHAVVALRY